MLAAMLQCTDVVHRSPPQDGFSADIRRGVDGTSRTEIGGPPRL
jgi:hypothetical protein